MVVISLKLANRPSLATYLHTGDMGLPGVAKNVNQVGISGGSYWE